MFCQSIPAVYPDFFIGLVNRDTFVSILRINKKNENELQKYLYIPDDCRNDLH